MKKRFLVLFSIVFVFGLFATVFALNGAKAGAENSSTCPMKASEMAQTSDKNDMSKVPVYVSEDSCCQPGADCCKGGACCKKKK